VQVGCRRGGALPAMRWPQEVQQPWDVVLGKGVFLDLEASPEWETKAHPDSQGCPQRRSRGTCCSFRPHQRPLCRGMYHSSWLNKTYKVAPVLGCMDHRGFWVPSEQCGTAGYIVISSTALT